MNRIGIATFARPDCNCGGIEDNIFNILTHLNMGKIQIFSFYCKDVYESNKNNELSLYSTPFRVKCSISELLHLSDSFKKAEFNIRLYFITRRLKLDLFIANGDNGAFAKSNKLISIQYGSTSINKIRKYISGNILKRIMKTVPLILSVFFEIISAKNSDHIIVDNFNIKGQVSKWNKNVTVDVIYDAIDTPSFSKLNDRVKLREKLGLDQNSLYAIWVSTDPSKGLNDAIESILRLKKTKLLVVGAKPNIRNDKIIYLGLLPHSKLSEFLNASDYFILPSMKKAVDLATIDAIFCHLTPVLYRKAYGFLFRDDEAVLCENKTDLFDNLMKIENNVDLLKKFNSSRLREEFNVESIASRYRQIIENYLQ